MEKINRKKKYMCSHTKILLFIAIFKCSHCVYEIKFYINRNHKKLVISWKRMENTLERFKKQKFLVANFWGFK